MRKCPKCGGEYPETTTLCPADGVALESTSDILIGQTLIGKYRIDERLNEGGMGAVYRGTHVLMDKTVAIKVLRPSLAADQKIVARFSREARAASRISHPHALSVTDFGESEDGVVFLVMEYLSGTTLKEAIRKNGPMPLGRVVDIIRQVGGALDAAHEQGVVHRDLKSENIMLLATGPEYAKVLDFGIAKIIEPEDGFDPGLTAPDLVIGTPQYMSPEQCSQAPDIDARSDVYSLGVIIHEMLVGHVPFTGESSTAIMLKHLQEPPPSVLEERPDLPAAVSRVLSRAMAKRREDRYQSVGDLVDDLAIAADTEGAGISAEAPLREPNVAEPQPARGVILNDENEETLVRPRVDTGPRVAPVPRTTEMYPPSSPRSINPWKILIPSLAGLLVIFAVVYAFTKSTEPTNTNQSEPGLVADPNSQAVQPSPPATGSGEAGIPSGGAASNPAATNSNVNANANANANAEETFTPDVNLNENANIEANQNSNANSNRPSADVPLPAPSRQVNSNQQQVPPPGNPTPESKPTSSPPPVQETSPL